MGGGLSRSVSVNPDPIKVAFLAGFDAGQEDAIDGGRIICDEYYREVTEAAYLEWVQTRQNNG